MIKLTHHEMPVNKTLHHRTIEILTVLTLLIGSPSFLIYFYCSHDTNNPLCQWLLCTLRKRSLDLSPFQITYLHSLIKKISKHLPLYKLPSKASGLKYLIISYVDKLFLKQKIQFHISNDLVAYSFYSFKTF